MTSHPDGADLNELRDEINNLKNTPVEQLVDPLPSELAESLPQAESTDAAGTEDWNLPEEPGVPTE